MCDEQLNRSQVYYGETMDLSGGPPEIQLTRFNTLTADGAQIVGLQQQQQLEQKPAAKWPWLTAGKRPFEAPEATCPPGDPFQVIWRQLSFEVSPSTYDQLIGRSLKCASALWPLGGRRKQKGGEQDELGPYSCSSSSSLAAGSSSKRVIFENLNGRINSGEISAILGPSGSGKTSLLNAICGRMDNYRGSVQLLGAGKRRMRLSIIPQKDYLIENLTVRENLLYSSKILNTDRQFQHEANVLRVAKMLNLANCLGASAANISGGEYKRVSIAQELLRQPDILILDEPTSGLDSLNCKNLIRSLAQLIEASRRGAIKPMAIVMTIHQPDVDIFGMFDHVYCMARGGRVIFEGPPSEVMSVVRAESGIAPELLPADASLEASIGANPANLLIEIASADLFGEAALERLVLYQRGQFEAQFAVQSADGGKPASNKSGLFGAVEHGAQSGAKKGLSLISCATSLSASSVSISSKSSAGASSVLSAGRRGQLVRDKRLTAKNDYTGQFWYHTGLLARRAFTSTLRDPLMTLTSLLFHLSIPFVMWTVYSQKTGSVRACPVIQRDMDMVSLVSNHTLGRVAELQDQIMTALECSTMFFLSTYSFSMCSLSMAALAFPLNMHVLLKEVRNGWYSLPSYVVAKTIANFPFEVLFPVVSLVMIYVMLGMPSSYLQWRLWAMALVMALISMISHTQGLIFGALCMDSVQSAIFLASASTLPLTLLSGFTARIRYMPLLLQKLSWLSLYRYSSDSINIIRFGFGTCPCDQSTDEYLRTKEPAFTDIPANVKPLFTYYLTNTAPGIESPQQAPTDNTSLSANASQLVSPLIPGVSYDLTLNMTERNELVRQLEANEIDLFGRMADLLARSFTYGRQVDDCESVRSQLLTTAGAPRDELLPLLFGGMFGLLLAAKLILFMIVKYKIGSRV